MESIERAIYKNWAGSQQEALVGVAYAQSTSFPKRTFSGVGEAHRVADARAIAWTLAINEASETLAAFWGERGRVESSAVRSFLERTVETVTDDITEVTAEDGGKLVRARFTLRVPPEFSREHWAGSFGYDARPEPIYFGDRVLLELGDSGASSGDQSRQAPRSSSVPSPSQSKPRSRQYCGVAGGQLMPSCERGGTASAGSAWRA